VVEKSSSIEKTTGKPKDNRGGKWVYKQGKVWLRCLITVIKSKQDVTRRFKVGLNGQDRSKEKQTLTEALLEVVLRDRKTTRWRRTLKACIGKDYQKGICVDPH